MYWLLLPLYVGGVVRLHHWEEKGSHRKIDVHLLLLPLHSRACIAPGVTRSEKRADVPLADTASTAPRRRL